MEAETEAMNGEKFFHPVIISYKCGKEPYYYITSQLEKPDYSVGIYYQQVRLTLNILVSGWSAKFKYTILVQQRNQSFFLLQMLVLKNTEYWQDALFPGKWVGVLALVSRAAESSQS